MSEKVAIQDANELTPKQEALIAALLTPLSIDAAAKAVGISDRTAHRWFKLSHFQVAYKAAQHRVFDEALNELRIDVSAAIRTLKRHMTDPETRPYVQVQAASIWLDKAIGLSVVY